MVDRQVPHADTALCTDPNHVCEACRAKHEAWLATQSECSDSTVGEPTG